MHGKTFRRALSQQKRQGRFHLGRYCGAERVTYRDLAYTEGEQFLDDPSHLDLVDESFVWAFPAWRALSALAETAKKLRPSIKPSNWPADHGRAHGGLRPSRKAFMPACASSLDRALAKAFAA